MTGQYERPPAPDPDLVLNLTLKVREMLPHRPGRWAWDLTDSRDGSWFESMWEFDSAQHAERSGRSRLAELIQSPLDAKPAAAAATTPPGQLIIVSPHDPEAYGVLTDLATKAGVPVIRDRRKPLVAMPRHGGERRSADVSAKAQARGWWVVRRSGPSHGSAASA